MPGGHANAGETPSETGSRELEEETGFKVKPQELKECRNGCVEGPAGQLHVTVMIAKLPKGQVPNIENDPDGEFSELAWINPLTHTNLHVPPERNLLIHHLRGVPDQSKQLNSIKKHDTLQKMGKKGDWKKEKGYKLHHARSATVFNVVASRNGKEVGEATASIGNDGRFIPDGLYVHKDHRRKGLATSMYQKLERMARKKLEPADGNSRSAKKLWSQPNRPFGKPLKKGELFKGQNGDWKKEGYTFDHEVAPTEQIDPNDYNPSKHAFVVTAVDKHGMRAGIGVFSHSKGNIVPDQIEINAPHQRKGIASSMYSYAEGISKKKLTPSDDQSAAAKALWSQKNRPFGKNEMKPKVPTSFTGRANYFAKLRAAKTKTEEPTSYTSRAAWLSKQPVKKEEEGKPSADFIVAGKKNREAFLKKTDGKYEVGHTNGIGYCEDCAVHNDGDLRVHVLKDGQEIAHAHIRGFSQPEIHSAGTTVHPDYRRKGLATAMYQHAEKITGKKMVPSDAQSDEARALWRQKKRPFGKSEYFLAKSKNVRAQKQKLFGGWNTPAGSKQRAKQMDQMTRYIEPRYNMKVVRAPGKPNKAGKIIDKPDLARERIEHIGNPDSLIHEIAHLETAPEGMPIKDFQQQMDDLWGKQNVQYGFKQQARLAPEYEATAIENQLRRKLGLPAHQKQRTVTRPEQMHAADRPETKVLRMWPGKKIQTKDMKGKPVVGSQHLAAGKEVLSPESKLTLILRESGKTKYNPKTGWKTQPTADTFIRLRQEGFGDIARRMAKEYFANRRKRSSVATELSYGAWGLQPAKKSELSKGVAQRKFPFNPATVNEDERRTVQDWVSGEHGRNVRNEIGRMGEANARSRALMKLGADTKVRRNPQTGEREFLLHRGVGPEEKAKVAPGKMITHQSNSSWTPKYDKALDFAHQYIREEHPGLPTSLESRKEHVLSAWFPESNIKYVPKQIGHVKGIRDYEYNTPTKDEYAQEHEVVVGPHSSMHIPNASDPQNVDEMIHERSKWTSGTSLPVMRATYPDYFRRRKLGKSEIAKAAPKIHQLDHGLHEMLGGTFGLISAHRSTSTPEMNEASSRSLESELKQSGYQYHPVVGKWGGSTENSFLVRGIPREHLTSLGQKYGQQAVIHGENGQHEEIGTHPEYQGGMKGTGFSLAPHAHDNYSEIDTPRGKVRFGLNFGNLKKSELRKAPFNSFSDDNNEHDFKADHQPVGQTHLENLINTKQIQIGDESLYHHVFSGGRYGLRHVLSYSRDPKHSGVINAHLQDFGSDDPPQVIATAVHPDHQGKGFGHALYNAMLQYHGSLESGSQTSPAANAIWKKLATNPAYKVILGPTDSDTPHYAKKLAKAKIIDMKTKQVQADLPFKRTPRETRVIRPDELNPHAPVKLFPGTVGHFENLQAKLKQKKSKSKLVKNNLGKNKRITHVQAEEHFQQYGPGQTSTAGMNAFKPKPGHTASGLPEGEYEYKMLNPKDVYRGSLGRTQSAKRFEEHDEKWAQKYADMPPSTMPAIIAKPHPERSGKFQVLDGATRLRAAHIARMKQIPAYVHVKKHELQKGALKLEHYSPTSGINEIDPTKHGSSHKGAELKRGPLEHPMSFFYEAGTKPEDLIAGKARSKYTVELDPQKHRIYDLDQDPAGIVRDAIKANQGAWNMDKVSHALKTAGYHGFRNRSSAIPNAVALFFPHKVSKEDPFKP